MAKAKITKAQVEKIRAEVSVPGIRSEKELFRYLAVNDYIEIDYQVFSRIIRGYKIEKGLTNIENSQKKTRKLTPIDKEFAKLVLFLMGKPLMTVREAFYLKSLKDGNVAEKYCRMYDKENKIEDAKLKAKEWTKADTSQINAQILSLADLLSRPAEPNVIRNMEDADE